MLERFDLTNLDNGILEYQGNITLSTNAKIQMRFLIDPSQNQKLLEVECFRYALGIDFDIANIGHPSRKWGMIDHYIEVYHPQELEKISDDMIREMSAPVDLEYFRW